MRKFYHGDECEIYDETDIKEIEKLFIGRKVKVISYDEFGGILELDNGIELEIVPNEGCGGCSSGWYYLRELNNVDNAITNVEFMEDEIIDNYGYCETSYKIFVFCEDKRIKLLQVDGDDGNGYYGTGYEIIVKIKEGEEYSS